MRATSPVPIWTMMMTLAACAGAFYVIMPDQTSVLERLIRDGKTARAYQIWKAIPATEIARNPAHHALVGLQLQRHLLDPTDDERAGNLLRQALKGYRTHSLAGEFLQEILALVPAARDPESALALVDPILDDCQAADREPLMRALIKSSLECGQPEVAALAYERCWPYVPHTEENLVDYVRMWRYADEQEKAIAVLERFEQADATNLFGVSATLGQLCIDILRELGRNEEAFQRLQPVVATAAFPQKSDLHVLHATASNTNQQKQLLVEYRRFLQEHPNDLEIWKQVSEIAVYCDDFATAEKSYQKLCAAPSAKREDFRSLAQIYEWTGHPSRAFDLYRPLAEAGDEAALNRLVNLNPGLYRDRELITVIQNCEGGRAASEHRLLLARLLTKHGRYSEADDCFRKYLQEHPDDSVALGDYGGMLKRQYAFAKALPVFAHLVEISPTNHPARKTIAELHYLLGDFSAALRSYKELARNADDLDVLRNYASLAEALGEYRDVASALKRQIQLDPAVSDFSYLKLAYILGLAGADRERLQALQDGLQRFRDSAQLKLQLAVVLVEQQDRGRAIAVMATHPELKTNLFALSLYLNLLVEHRDYATAQAVLKSGVPAYILRAPQLAAMSALVYEGTGDYATAEGFFRRLYHDYPDLPSYALSYASLLARREKFVEVNTILQKLLRQPSAEILGEAARLYYEMGEFRQAEQLQRRYLQSRKNVAFHEWSYLGDICSAAGNRTGARQAYARAVSLLEDRIKKQ